MHKKDKKQKQIASFDFEQSPHNGELAI